MKWLLLGGIFLPLAAVSQKLENMKAIAEGDKISVTYDIEDGFGNPYSVSLYASYNSYNTALQLVTGDVGQAISAGKNKKIEWDAKREMGNFKGEISFELRAAVSTSFRLKNEIGSAKRGKEINILWAGGILSRVVRIELLNAGETTEVIGEVVNNGSFEWVVPDHHKTGKDFQFRLVNGNEVIITKPFSIKQKVPTAIKFAPIVLLSLVALPGSQSADEKRVATKVSVASIN